MGGPDSGCARVRLLVLGGSTEATELVRALNPRVAEVAVVLSYAGRTKTRLPPPPGVEVRVGGFGGINGLEDYLRLNAISAVIDATHPFATRMPFNATEACHAVDVPLLRVVRKTWVPEPGDRWINVATVDDAAQAVQGLSAQRVLLTIGRQELRAFAQCDANFVARCIDLPDPGVLPGATILLARAPFTVDGELDVLRDHHIDLIVSKNAGGSATSAKLVAARHLGIQVVMIARPAAPPGETVELVEDAVAWVARNFGGEA